MLILEVFNPISFLEKIPFTGSFFLEDHQKYENLDLKIVVKHSVDEQNQLVKEIKEVYNLSSGKLLHTDRTKFRMYFPQELRYYLNQSGFEAIGQYGRYDESYKQLDRTRLIIIAIRKD